MHATVVSTSERASGKRILGWGFFLALGLILLFTQTAALAQTASGSIDGTVVDKTGAVVPNAKVVLQNEATTTTREMATTGSGIFNFPAVQPGTYTVTVTSTGMATYERKGIVVTQGTPVGLGLITLQLASTQQQIEVVGASEVLVPVDTPQSSQTLNQKLVEDLSIVGRA